MASLDWSQCSAVESIADRLSGAWVFKNTRMPVSTVLENLGAGATVDEIIEWFDLTREQVVAVLEFAARSLDAPNPPRREDHSRPLLMRILFDHGAPAPLIAFEEGAECLPATVIKFIRKAMNAAERLGSGGKRR